MADRYVDLGLLGRGGMGEVRRVLDRHLDRVVARKRLTARPGDAAARRAFLREAKATAKLQHARIVPVYDLGEDADGTPWFTMKEVAGQGFDRVIEAAHERPLTPERIRPLVAALREVARAVAYANQHDAFHRDLKPSNVMVGDHGEVTVLDWGLVASLGRSNRAGTPAYMAPEQLRGEVHPSTDVFSLGAMLHHALAGHPPFRDGRVPDADPTPLQPETLPDVLQRHAGRAPEPTDAPRLPRALVTACRDAMQHDPARRTRSARRFAEQLDAWLEGAERADEARQLVAYALRGVAEAEALVRRADALQAEGDRRLADVPDWAPVADKEAGWAQQDTAHTLRQAAARRQREVDHGLHAALQVHPASPEAHAALVTRHLERHSAAERRGDVRARDREAGPLAHHAVALPDDHAARAKALDYLRGDGALTVRSEPPGARVVARRLATRGRRRQPQESRVLGTTPLDAVPLPMGSYLLTLEHPDRAAVTYPVFLGRQAHWQGRRPGERSPAPVWLPPVGHLGPDERYVPAGWYRSGGHDGAPLVNRWLDGFIAQAHPVTNRGYLAFLDDLVACGEAARAVQLAPHERASGGQGEVVYGRDAEGRFVLRADADGDPWRLDDPVVLVDWHAATAYAAWRAQRDGRPWRLPSEHEWEKMARGVDGRRYPWGDHADPSFAAVLASHQGAPRPKAIDAFPHDTSPYGVRHLAGNVKTWCADRHGPPPDGPLPDDRTGPGPGDRQARGAHWFASAPWPAGRRDHYPPTFFDAGLGLRIVRSVDPRTGNLE